jgi:hypothetical protein
MRFNLPSTFVLLISLVLATLALAAKFGAVKIERGRRLPEEHWLSRVRMGELALSL